MCLAISQPTHASGFRQKSHIKNLINGERAAIWKRALPDAAFRGCLDNGDLVLLINHLSRIILETRAFLYQLPNLLSLLDKRSGPTSTARRRLVFPFEKMPESSAESAFDFPPVVAPQACDLLCEVIPIKPDRLPACERARLLFRPPVKIGVIEAREFRLPGRGSHETILKQKIPLRHRQDLGRLAGEKLAVRAHFIGFGIDLDVRGRGIV